MGGGQEEIPDCGDTGRKEFRALTVEGIVVPMSVAAKQRTEDSLSVFPFSTTSLLTNSGPPRRFVRARTGLELICDRNSRAVLGHSL